MITRLMCLICGLGYIFTSAWVTITGINNSISYNLFHRTREWIVPAIFVILFLLARFILPFTSTSMISDFKACGGFLMLATGFRMVKLKMFPIAEMIPAMILVMPLSWLWSDIILKLIH